MRIASTKPHNNRAREILTREYLEREYITNYRSAGNIGRELGVHQGVVINRLRVYGFEVRPNGSYDTSCNFGKYSELKYIDMLTRDYLRKEYVEKQRSAADIDKEIGAHNGATLEYLRRFGFEIRDKAFYLRGERHPIYGLERTEEWCNKISKAKMGKYGGENNSFWGRKHTSETRDLISKHHADVSLENHPRWKGGKSFEPYTIEFNRQLKGLIRDRDKHTCQLCGVPECECREKLHTHHIDYGKENCLPSNLISLCRSCHTKTNENREYWTDYFDGVLSGSYKPTT